MPFKNYTRGIELNLLPLTDTLKSETDLQTSFLSICQIATTAQGNVRKKMAFAVYDVFMSKGTITVVVITFVRFFPTREPETKVCL